MKQALWFVNYDHARRIRTTGWNHQALVDRGRQNILLKNTVGGLSWIALLDFVHHRGQLTTYIRPMGGQSAEHLRALR